MALVPSRLTIWLHLKYSCRNLSTRKYLFGLEDIFFASHIFIKYGTVRGAPGIGDLRCEGLLKDQLSSVLLLGDSDRRMTGTWFFQFRDVNFQRTIGIDPHPQIWVESSRRKLTTLFAGNSFASRVATSTFDPTPQLHFSASFWVAFFISHTRSSPLS